MLTNGGKKSIDTAIVLRAPICVLPNLIRWVTIFPISGCYIGRSAVEFSIALVDGKPSDSVQIALMSAALSGLQDESVFKKLFAGSIQRVPRAPAARFHNRPRHSKIAVVAPSKLSKEVNQKLDAFAAQSCVGFALEHSMRHCYKAPVVSSTFCPPTLVGHVGLIISPGRVDAILYPLLDVG